MSTARKARFTLMKPEAEAEAAAAMASGDPKSALADLFVNSRMKASKRSDEFFKPGAGQAVFDGEEGALHVHDGAQVHAGRPSTPCPDCEGDLVLEMREQSRRRSPWSYICENRAVGCRGSCAAKVDGSLLGIPANAETRRARRLTREVFDSVWQRAPSVLAASTPETREAAEVAARSQAYRWFAHAMDLAGKPAGIATMNIETLRRAWKLCREADPAKVESFVRPPEESPKP